MQKIANRKGHRVTVSTWDNQELESQFSQCENVRDVISKLESDFSERGEVICEIRVNGVLLEEADETKFADSSIKEITHLSVRSNRPDALIVEALTSANQFAPQVEAHCLKTADLLRGTNLAQAQTAFQEVIEGCQWLVDTLVHSRNAAANIGAPVAQAEEWLAAEQTATRVVTEICSAFELGDQALVADLLEYELTSTLSAWHTAIAIELHRRQLDPG